MNVDVFVKFLFFMIIMNELLDVEIVFFNVLIIVWG